MSVTIVDNRLTWNDCTDTTGWGGPESATPTTTAPSPVEGTTCLGFTISEQTNYAYYQTTARNLSNSLIYHWNQVVGAVNATQVGGVQLILGDGTNIVGFHMAGDDLASYRYNELAPLWQCLVLDGSVAKTKFDNVTWFFTNWTGSLTNLNLAAITQIGMGWGVASKSLGGGRNCYADISRTGAGGISIIGGTTSARGNFSEVYTDENLRTALHSYGICRSLTTGTYGLQGPIICGSTGTGSSYFRDASGTSVVYENRLVADDKYYFKVLASAGFQTHVTLDQFNMSTAGPKVLFDASIAKIAELSITNSSFKSLGKPMSFARDGSAQTHVVTNNIFSGVGMIDPGTTIFTDNTISNTTEPSTRGALLIDQDASANNLSNLTFIAKIQSDVSNHAIYITQPGEYTFTNFSYEGYATLDGSTGGEPIYNNSGGHVIINLVGGDWPFVQNAIDASTDVVNNITLSMTVTGEDQLPIVGAKAYIDDPTNTEPYIMNTLTNGSGIATVGWGGGPVAGAYWRVRLYGYKPFLAISNIGAVDKDIPVTLVKDPQQY